MRVSHLAVQQLVIHFEFSCSYCNDVCGQGNGIIMGFVALETAVEIKNPHLSRDWRIICLNLLWWF